MSKERVLQAVGAGILTASIAACGNGEAPKNTPVVTAVPTEGPTQTATMPSLQPSPTFEVTPAPTASPTEAPTATPEINIEPLKESIQKIVDDANKNGWSKASESALAKNVKDSLQKAYDTDSQAAAVINPNTNEPEKTFINGLWESCSTGSDQQKKMLSCAALTGHVYYEGELIDGNQDAWSPVLKNIVVYAHKILNAQNFQAFLGYAEARQKPF